MLNNISTACAPLIRPETDERFALSLAKKPLDQPIFNITQSFNGCDPSPDISDSTLLAHHDHSGPSGFPNDSQPLHTGRHITIQEVLPKREYSPLRAGVHYSSIASCSRTMPVASPVSITSDDPESATSPQSFSSVQVEEQSINDDDEIELSTSPNVISKFFSRWVKTASVELKSPSDSSTHLPNPIGLARLRLLKIIDGIASRLNHKETRSGLDSEFKPEADERCLTPSTSIQAHADIKEDGVEDLMIGTGGSAAL